MPHSVAFSPQCLVPSVFRQVLPVGFTSASFPFLCCSPSDGKYGPGSC